MNDEQTNDPTVDEETDAAAEEAGAIGGPGADQDLDPAERAPAEGGGGESEGFEQAEKDLIEHASHGENGPDPTTRATDEPAPPGFQETDAG